MAEFECKVADPAGKISVQVEAAQSEAEARQRLGDRGLYVYSVRQRARLLPQLGERRGGRTVGGTDFLIFNQQFNTLIKAGLPILKALDLLAERAAVPRLRPLLRDVRDRVREGALLSEALEKEGAFPKVYTTSVLAGEKSGNLSGVLEYFIAYQKVTTGFQRRLVAALIYPCILVIVTTLILSYIVAYVIPQFARLYTELNVPLPTTTQFLVTMAVGYRWYFLGVIVAIVLGATGAYAWSFSEKGGVAVDRFKFRFPVFGEIWVKFQVAQLVRTLATLLAGGTPLVNALETTANATDSRLIGGAVAQSAQRVREGASLHQSLADTGVMPALAIEMIEVGEATGALAPMLSSVAEFYEEDVNLRLQALLNLIQPVILVLMAIVVAFILISLYLPVFQFSLSGTAR
ncbi:MAG: type II secretion system F family protein [Acidobacteria bacterium]|nr:type II secretion system F family protein [Acidobacteriota bacterium]MCL5288234.1 type II secretion system F family protein [Acidobacteriota bacterium]